MESLLQTPFATFAIALLIGALVGIERELQNTRETAHATAGLRTFSLIALLGALAAWIDERNAGHAWLFAVGAAVVGSAMLVGYSAQARAHPAALGLTSEIAALATYLLGGLVAQGERALAISLAIVLTTLLAYKQPLHGLVQRMRREDLYAVLQLLIASFIVLPILPTEAFDPWAVLVPRQLWLLALLISGLSFAGYVAGQALGNERGTALTGLLGGLVSSTAVTLSFARQSRAQNAPAALCGGLLLSWSVMFGRIAIMVLIVNRVLLEVLWPALCAMGLVSALAGAWLLLQAQRRPGVTTAPTLANPFELFAALKFTAFFALVLVLIAVAREEFNGTGVYAVAALAGTTDVDAITLSMARASASDGGLELAAGAITLAASANTVVKAGMVLVLARGSMRRQVAWAALLMLVAGAVTLMAMH